MRNLNVACRKAALIAFCAITMLAVLAAIGVWRYGTFPACVNALQGHVVYIDPEHCILKDVKVGDHVSVPIRVRNISSRSVGFLGSHSDCSCLVTEGLPFELAPRETRELRLEITVPQRRDSYYESSVTFFLNGIAEQPRVVVTSRVLADR